MCCKQGDLILGELVGDRWKGSQSRHLSPFKVNEEKTKGPGLTLINIGVYISLMHIMNAVSFEAHIGVNLNFVLHFYKETAK